MIDLVERYIQQVGRYLPRHERAEIEAELRSIIYDQLDDRFGESVTPTNIAAVLSELGSPQRIAASYRTEQYLVGPDLYPYMVTILRRGWLFIPAIIVFWNVFEASGSDTSVSILGLFTATMLMVLQSVFFFSGVVVMLFAGVQYMCDDIIDLNASFDPLHLPEMDDPTTVDQPEARFGVIIGILFVFVLTYFLSVGGLTLHANPSDDADVIATPTTPMILLIINTIVLTGLQLQAFRANRWTFNLYALQSLVTVIGVIFLYLAVLEPLGAHIAETTPILGDLRVFNALPEAIAILMAVLTIFDDGSRLIHLWHHRHIVSSNFIAQPDS